MHTIPDIHKRLPPRIILTTVSRRPAISRIFGLKLNPKLSFIPKKLFFSLLGLNFSEINSNITANNTKGTPNNNIV